MKEYQQVVFLLFLSRAFTDFRYSPIFSNISFKYKKQVLKHPKPVFLYSIMTYFYYALKSAPSTTLMEISAAFSQNSEKSIALPSASEMERMMEKGTLFT